MMTVTVRMGIRLKGIKNYITRLKQRDRVKFKLIFVILGLFFIYMGADKGYIIYKELLKPVEYEVITTKQTGPDESDVNAIKSIDGVTNVTLIKEQSVIFMNYKDEVNVNVRYIDSRYMEEVYGINGQEGNNYDNMLFVNKNAYKQISGNGLKDNEEKYEKVSVVGRSNDKEYIFNIIYEDNLDRLSGRTNESLCIMKDNGIVQNNSGLLVQFKNDDITDENIKKLQGEGYAVKDMEEHMISMEKNDKEMVRVKYNLIIGAMCLVFSVMISRVKK